MRCQWSIPAKRTVDPSKPVEAIAFQKVSSQKAFQPLLEDEPDKKRLRRSIKPPSTQDLLGLRSSLRAAAYAEDSMVLLRYLGVEDDSSSEDGEEMFPHLRFDNFRPSAIQFPSNLATVFNELNRDPLPPSPVQIEKWSELMINGLSQVDREEILKATKHQASSPRWYTERICRLTASNFGLIAKRREVNMLSLVDQLLYTSPPVSVSSIKFGRDNEPLAVQLYEKLMTKNGHPVEVQQTGLHVHPTFSFLAASPDRLVVDKSMSPTDGLLEVKCMPSINGRVEDQIGAKQLYLVKDVNGSVHLSHTHSYYYQIQGQLACTGRKWCDFVIMSNTKDLYAERIAFEEVFWLSVLPRLKRFYRQYYVRELVYPCSRALPYTLPQPTQVKKPVLSNCVWF